MVGLPPEAPIVDNPKGIPGQLRDREKLAIALLARLVPGSGTIVEVGSLLGLSGWLWSKNADPSVTVFCIDPWERTGGSGFVKLAKEHGQSFSLAQFKKNVADCPNVVPLQGLSPQDFANWDRPVALYFEDAVHKEPELSRNLDFWRGRLTSTGILCGHDYIYASPAVIGAVDRLAGETGRRLGLVQSLWYLLPREIEDSGDPHIRRAVDALAAQNTPPLPDSNR